MCWLKYLTYQPWTCHYLTPRLSRCIQIQVVGPCTNLCCLNLYIRKGTDVSKINTLTLLEKAEYIVANHKGWWRWSGLFFPLPCQTSHWLLLKIEHNLDIQQRWALNISKGSVKSKLDESSKPQKLSFYNSIEKM